MANPISPPRRINYRNGESTRVSSSENESTVKTHGAKEVRAARASKRPAPGQKEERNYALTLFILIALGLAVGAVLAALF